MSTWLVPREELTVEQRRAVELPPAEHLVLLGGPGSGKTVVLVHRASHLRQACQTPRHRFHIFVFTNVLKDYIRSALELLDLPPSCVSTLDAWCCEYYENSIRHYLPWDPVRNSRDFPTIRWEVMEQLKREGRERPIFDFLLVDEGQDLEAGVYELLRLLGKHVTVCMDHNQQIYDGGAKLDEVQTALGVRRRNVAFLETFRCCPYIVDLASQFIDDPQEREQYIRQTRTTNTDIETPVLYYAQRASEERQQLIETVRVRLSRGEKIGILLPQRRQVFALAAGLRKASLPVETPGEMNFESDVPKIMPYHSAKGLTFDAVLLPRLSATSFAKVSDALVRRLLFVGISRATRWVYLSTTEEGFVHLEPLRRLGEERRLTVRRADAEPAEGAPRRARSRKAVRDPLDFL